MHSFLNDDLYKTLEIRSMQIRDEKRRPRMMRQTGRRKLKLKLRPKRVIRKKRKIICQDVYLYIIILYWPHIFYTNKPTYHIPLIGVRIYFWTRLTHIYVHRPFDDRDDIVYPIAYIYVYYMLYRCEPCAAVLAVDDRYLLSFQSARRRNIYNNI